MAQRNFYEVIPEALSDFARIYYQNPMGLHDYEGLRDSLSFGQMQSKIRCLELLSQFNITADKALFIGHWHGLLPNFMKRMGVLNSAVGYEKDPHWVRWSKEVNSWWDWNSQEHDVESSRDFFASFDLYVNTSCEHMSDSWIQRLPSNALVLAQSTDYQHPDHINTVQSIEEFAARFPRFKILASMETPLEIYRRFTILAAREVSV